MAAIILGGIAGAAELALGLVVTAVSIGATLLVRSFLDVPALNTLFTWVSRLYWGGAAVFTGLEIGLSMSRLKHNWMLSLMNVGLWPLMLAMRYTTAERVRKYYDTLKSGDYTVKSLSEVTPCEGMQWFGAPDLSFHPEHILSGGDIITDSGKQTGPINCIIRETVSDFVEGLDPKIKNHEIVESIQNGQACMALRDVQQRHKVHPEVY